MPAYYQHEETRGLRVKVQHDPEFAAAVKTRAGSMLCLLCDLVNLELGTEPHAGTPQQQSLGERARELFISLGVGSAVGDEEPAEAPKQYVEQP